VVQDFGHVTVFTWAPLDEGTYTIEVTVRSRSTREVEFVLAEPYEIESPTGSGPPVVSATAHPLIALYSAPPCATGRMRIRFAAPEAPAQVTHANTCDGVHGMNFWIAGMRADTTYELQSEVRDDSGVLLEQGPPLAFTTGVPPVALPQITVTTAPTRQSSVADSIVLASAISSLSIAGAPNFPFAVDLEGRLVWYQEPPADVEWLPTRLADGGRVLLLDPDLREIDLAGYTLRATSAARISEQLVALGLDPIGSLHHEANELPDGRIAVLASVERILEDVQGPGPVDVVGDMVIVLDADLQVVWAWNSFDHLDPTRLATLGETCPGGGCPPLVLAVTGTDWTHSNSVTYSPEDGNLLLSIRHQDWVVKIDYQDGAGTGEVIWRLGREGDFALSAGGEESWPYHQHDAAYVGEDHVLMYANGNASPACLANALLCESRGLVFRLDEENRIATPVLEAGLDVYSPALGTAQRLGNGNYWFDSGFLGAPDFYSTLDEITPAEQRVFSLRAEGMSLYRAIRAPDLYTAPQQVPEAAPTIGAIAAWSALAALRPARAPRRRRRPPILGMASAPGAPPTILGSIS
jgi:hypothetical protein